MRSKEEHRKYINSDLWKTKREEALAHHGHRCASCGTTKNIQVHHISYLRLSHNGPGKETMEDLIPLCGRHHQLVHKLIDELKERKIFPVITGKKLLRKRLNLLNLVNPRIFDADKNQKRKRKRKNVLLNPNSRLQSSKNKENRIKKN